MEKNYAQKQHAIIGMSGYSPEFKQKLKQLVDTLYNDIPVSIISTNTSIITAADHIMKHYKDWNPTLCTWRDEGPAPYDKDYLSSILEDYNDLMVILQGTEDSFYPIGIRLNYAHHAIEQYRYHIASATGVQTGSADTEQELIDRIICRTDSILNGNSKHTTATEDDQPL